jgi:hypothetical protein
VIIAVIEGAVGGSVMPRYQKYIVVDHGKETAIGQYLWKVLAIGEVGAIACSIVALIVAIAFVIKHANDVPDK